MATRYVALLRGINVGGGNKIKMDELRTLFTGLGYTDTQTYLQSGNVIFGAPDDAVPADLASAVEKTIQAELGLTVGALVRSDAELAKILTANPYREEQDDSTKLHVTFLVDAPEADLASALQIPAGETGVLTVIGSEVYLHCPDGYGRTKLNNAFLERKLGTAATTRNWRTVVALHDLAAD